MGDQDSTVGRSWAHLLQWGHQNYCYLQSKFLQEETEDQQKIFYITKGIKKEPQWDGYKKWTHGICKTHTPDK